MLGFVIDILFGVAYVGFVLALFFGAGGLVHLVIINIWRFVERNIKKFLTSEKTKL